MNYYYHLHDLTQRERNAHMAYVRDNSQRNYDRWQMAVRLLTGYMRNMYPAGAR